ncbi:hypothetical protein Pelo_4976 [Pelomyxa schiedti]|nr:hypothetical protein Pelo_4976 [Pelomyxa schiedti]
MLSRRSDRQTTSTTHTTYHQPGVVHQMLLDYGCVRINSGLREYGLRPRAPRDLERWPAPTVTGIAMDPLVTEGEVFCSWYIPASGTASFCLVNVTKRGNKRVSEGNLTLRFLVQVGREWFFSPYVLHTSPPTETDVQTTTSSQTLSAWNTQTPSRDYDNGPSVPPAVLPTGVGTAAASTSYQALGSYVSPPYNALPDQPSVSSFSVGSPSLPDNQQAGNYSQMSISPGENLFPLQMPAYGQAPHLLSLPLPPPMQVQLQPSTTLHEHPHLYPANVPSHPPAAYDQDPHLLPPPMHVQLQGQQPPLLQPSLEYMPGDSDLPDLDSLFSSYP